MAWLGAGDLVGSSVAGGSYGYTLMWALVLALFSRYFFTAAIAKYGLCNATGEASIITGFGRLWRHFPAVIGVLAFLSGFILQTYMGLAVGTALYHLSGGIGGPTWGIFLWTAVTALMLVRRGRLRRPGAGRPAQRRRAGGQLRGGGRARAPGPGRAGPRPGVRHPAEHRHVRRPAGRGRADRGRGRLRGQPDVPGVHPEQGWHGPAFLKLQRIDLLLGVLAVIVVNLAIWIVGAEVIRANGMSVSEIGDLATMMQIAVGSAGPWILWVGLFFVAFSSFPSYASGYTQILFRGLYESWPRRRDRYQDMTRDPAFNWLQIGVMVVIPLAFALPGLPDVLVMTVVASSTAALLAPVIMVGTLVLTNNKRLMLPGHTNRWYFNVVLVAVGCVGIWATHGVVRGLIELVS